MPGNADERFFSQNHSDLHPILWQGSELFSLKA